MDDRDGGVTLGNTPVTVNNVAPTITSIVADPPELPHTGTSTITVNATDPAGANDPLLYSFDCNGDGDFFDTGDAANQTANSTSCTIAGGPAAVTVKVQVDDQDGGITTGNVLRVTFDTTPPAAPVLLAQADGAVLNTRTVDFRWQVSTSDDVASYRIQVTSSDINDGPYDVDKVLRHPITGDRITLSMDGTYRWRVGAWDIGGNETPTGDLDVRGFTVDTRRFSSTEHWSVGLDFSITGGLPGDPNPRVFGVHPACSLGFDQSFINEEPYDRGRAVFFSVPFMASFHYPNNPDLSSFKDETRLLVSRYSPGAGDVTELDWPVRIELAGVPPGDYVVSFSWKNADVAAIPNDPPREVVLLDNAGDRMVDFRTGAGSAGVTCTPTADGHSCSITLRAASSVVKDYTIRVSFEEPNAAPEASPQVVSGDTAAPATIQLTGSDPDTGDTLRFIIASLPRSGTLSEGATPIGTAGYVLSGDTVTYTPNWGFVGADTFDFQVTDGKATSNIATITVNALACFFPRGMVKQGWTLIGWACNEPGDPHTIAARLGGFVRLLEWDAVSQSFTRSFSSTRPFNTLSELTKWNGYWLFHQP